MSDLELARYRIQFIAEMTFGTRVREPLRQEEAEFDRLRETTLGNR